MRLPAHISKFSSSTTHADDTSETDDLVFNSVTTAQKQGTLGSFPTQLFTKLQDFYKQGQS